MPPVTGTLPNLLNGVSRQPPAVRLPTQLEEQINLFSTPSQGLQQRPPSFHVENLGTDIPAGSFVHHINRDQAERYHVIIKDDDLYVFDQYGVEKTVEFPDGKAYLNCGSDSVALSSFSAATSADHTFITNKLIEVEMDDASEEPARGQEALVFVRAVNYSRTYRIYIDGAIVAEVSMTAALSDGDDNQKRQQATATQVNLAKMFFWGDEVTDPVNGWTGPDGWEDGNFLDNLVNERLVDNLDPADWEVVRYNNVLHIKRIDGTPFTIRSECDLDGGIDSVVCMKSIIQDFSDLPNHGPVGYVIKVTGTPTQGFDDYWVKLTKPEDDDDNDSVVWRECAAPETLLSFDPATMPHILVREADGDFTFKEATWVSRKVGEDADGGKKPSFVGEAVNDVFFHRGRLGFLANESVILTRPAEFFDFWRTSLTAIVDDDPIDVAGTDEAVSVFRHAITFDEDLYIASANSLHRLGSGDLLTQKTVALKSALNEPVYLTASPVSTTKSIFFATSVDPSGGFKQYSDIRELIVLDDNNNKQSGSVSDHVPGYIPPNINKLVVSPANNLLFGFTNEDDGFVYVYQYYWSGNEKLQSAWHRWEFGDNVRVVSACFFDSDLHLVLRRGGSGAFLERVPCTSYLADTDQEWMIRLDRRISSDDLAAPTYSALNDETTYTLPYAPTSLTRAHSIGDDFGVSREVVDFDGTAMTVTLDGDTTEDTLVFDRLIDSRFTLSQLFVRRPVGGALSVVQARRLQILRIFPQYVGTAYFRVETSPNRNADAFSKIMDFTTEFSAILPDDEASELDEVVLRDGSTGVGIKSNSKNVIITIINDTALPSVFTGLEWEGLYVPRAKATN